MRGEVRAGDPAASLAMRSPGETATLSVPCVFPMHAFTIHATPGTCPLEIPQTSQAPPRARDAGAARALKSCVPLAPACATSHRCVEPCSRTRRAF